MSKSLEQKFEVIDDAIKSLDLMNEKIAEKATEAMMTGAKIIEAEQRRLISARSAKFAGLIKVGKLRTSKKGALSVDIGYDTKALDEGFEGLVMEFGRPGEKRQARGGKDTLGRTVGRVEPTPHIRRGFDNTAEEAAQKTLDMLWEVAEQCWTS